MSIPRFGTAPYFLVALVFLVGMTQAARGEERGLQTEANVMVELTFESAVDHADPFNDLTLDVVFTDPKKKEFRVPAFWAGGKTWKARYASPEVGTHTYRSECSIAKDEGLHGSKGDVKVTAYTGDNALYQRGPLRVSEDKRHFVTADGKPFFWLGDTWWMGLSKRLTWPKDVKTLAQDRKRKGFNVIQIVMGPPPDSHPFDPRSVNETGFPWEKDYTAIRPSYYDAADERIMYLVDEGFTPCLFGMWGYHIRFMGVERAKQHWRYLIARYGALPVVWSAAGEANLSWYLAPGFPYHDKEQVTQWTEVTRYLHETDPFDRLVTIHPTGFGWTSRDAIDDDSLLDFNMLQTPHGQREAVPVTLEIVRRSYAAEPVMPTINGEAAYEMLSDTLPTLWTRRMFWLCMTNGAAGHTYGANGIWQVNRPGDPHGPSPHMPAGTGYGAITWEDAMNLPGSTHVSLGKKLFQEFAWHEFTPHPEWATFAGRSLISLDAGKWIWFPEGDPTQDAPAEKRYFRRSFAIPAGKMIKSARLRVSADNAFTAHVNGKALGTGSNWQVSQQFEDFAAALKPGTTNVIAIVAENQPSPGANPAGLIAGLDIQFDDGESLKIDSDESWRASKSEPDGWNTAGFDDAAWSQAKAIAPYGQGPWGAQMDPPVDHTMHGPQSTGIPGVVRITYVPDPMAIEVHDLDKAATYVATCFDPMTGAKTPLPPVKTGENGSWTCPPPPGIDHDWVVILERKENP